MIYDIIVIGGGPAGLTAGIYALRSGKTVLIIEKNVFGGQITNSPKVENIPGFASISGDEFAEKYLDQVMGQGAEVRFDEATGIVPTDEHTYKVTFASGEEALGVAVILATGTKHRSFGFEGEEELIGNGVHFCAVCDGDFYAGKDVVMVGGGNSAFVEGNLLADVVKSLIILQDMPYFTADEKLQGQLLGRNNVEAHVGTKVLGYEISEGKLTGVRYEEDGKEQIASCEGVFLAIGLMPDNEAFTNVADIDKPGYFIADEYGKTKTKGIFVAGDCRTKNLRQVATACADGANAAIEAIKYIGSQE